MPSARSTVAARWVPRAVTQRLVLPSPTAISTTRTVLSALRASEAEKSRPAALSFFSIARRIERGDKDVRLDSMVDAVIDRPHVDHVLEISKARSTSDSSL
jgi:hypothetical protein